MRIGAILVVMTAAMTLAACATAPDPIAANLPLRMAFSEPVDSLREKSAAGDRNAQYGLSLLMKLGLRGVEVDALGSEALRAQAGRTVTTSQAIYVPPAVKGGSGSVMNVNSASPGITDEEARRLDMCGFTALTGAPAMGGILCGSPEAYADLLAVVAPYRAELMANRGLDVPADVDPASVGTCEERDELWATAARHMGMAGPEAVAKAEAASQRIIELCGEAEASWHARVMRANLYLMADQPQAAVEVLRPLPIPAPRPIGGFGALTLMKAQSRLGDWSGYARTRDALMAASIEALASEPGGHLVERFDARNGAVSLFERKGRSSYGLTFLRMAVVEWTDTQARPLGYVLSTSSMGGADRGFFLDEYSCEGRGTLRYFEAMPTDAVIRDVIRQRMAGELELVTLRVDHPGPVCRWPGMVAPGLGNDPTIRVEYQAQAAD